MIMIETPTPSIAIQKDVFKNTKIKLKQFSSSNVLKGNTTKSNSQMG